MKLDIEIVCSSPLALKRVDTSTVLSISDFNIQNGCSSYKDAISQVMKAKSKLIIRNLDDTGFLLTIATDGKVQRLFTHEKISPLFEYAFLLLLLYEKPYFVALKEALECSDEAYDDKDRLEKALSSRL